MMKGMKTMIQATFKQKDNKIYWFKVTGHANSAPYGQDIVCAGVSSLYITITNQLLKLGRTFERDEGFFILDGQAKEEVCVVLLHDGIAAIAKEYPEYMIVEVIGNE